MTPKEKAIEIVNRFRPYVYFSDGNNSMNVQLEIDENSKSCAIECADEILNCIYAESTEFLGHLVDNGYSADFWNEVKQEIEKL